MATKMRQIRQHGDSSLSAFARRLDIHHSLLCNVETGKAVCPLKWRSIIAEALGVTVGEIFNDRGFALEAAE